MGFDPKSEVTIYKTKGYAILLLVKQPHDGTYYLFTINTLNGSFFFDGCIGSSIFRKKTEAFSYISKNYDFSFDDVTVAQALIGAARYGPYLHILVVTGSKPFAKIQNKHTVFMITKSEFYTIFLPFYPPLTPQEQRRVDRIKQFPIEERHFWCETTDLTTPIFCNNLHNDSFVWNSYWKEPFNQFGLGNVCIDMLQGTAISRVIDYNNDFLRFTIITIRESSNGGTRYFSRGLDDDNHCGNEVQSELIVESNSGQIWSHVWRRGSIPIKWRSIVAKNLPTVSIAIENNPGKNTHVYFDRLHEIFEEEIRCVNLLHNQPGNSELPLCVEFRNAVEDLENVSYVEFDWHQEVKTKGTADAVKSFYSILSNINFTYSRTDTPLPVPLPLPKPDPYAIGEELSSVGKKSMMTFLFQNEKELPPLGEKFISTQKSIIRVNCMDSLDRTNVACFFYAAKVISKILEEFGGFKEITNYDELFAIPLSIREFICDAFLDIGDVVAFLYTNTPACMTEIFLEVATSDAKTKSDSSIAVQRRYNNFLKDKNRQKQYDMFKGKRFDFLIPALSCGHVPRCVSMPPFAQVLPPLDDLTSLLQLSAHSITVSSCNHFLLLLSHYSYVDSICIVLSPVNTPTSVKISCSLTLGPITPLVPRFALPQVSKVTPVMIKVPPEYANHDNFPQRYLWFEFESSSHQMTFSNIFVFGENVKKKDDNIYSFLYQKMKTVQPKDNEICADFDTALPTEVLKNNTEFDFDVFVRFEIARVLHKMGRLESLSLAAMKGFNPLDFSINKLKIECSVPVIEKSDICCKCQKSASWKCFSCLKTFCNSTDCAFVHNVNHDLYYSTHVMICDECSNKLEQHVKLVQLLSKAYSIFYRLLYPEEFKTSQFVENWIDKTVNIVTDPSRFPNAFFQNALDPKHNLVLTENNTSVITAPSPQLCLALGRPLHVTEILICGSNDLELEIWMENGKNKVFLKSNSNSVDFEGRFFYLILRKGSLSNIHFSGEDLSKEPFGRNTPVGSKKTIKSLKNAKSVPMISCNHTIQTDCTKPADIKGIVFSGITGAHAILVYLYDSSNKAQPICCIPYYLPFYENEDFILKFEKPQLASRVDVQFIDVSNSFKEPKISLF